MPQSRTPITCLESSASSHTPWVYSSQSSHCNVSECKSDHVTPLTRTLCLLPMLAKIDSQILQWPVRHSMICTPNTTLPLTPCPVFRVCFPSSAVPALQPGTCQACPASGPRHCQFPGDTSRLLLSHYMSLCINIIKAAFPDQPI